MYLILFCSWEVVFSFFPGGQEDYGSWKVLFSRSTAERTCGNAPTGGIYRECRFSVAVHVCILKFAGAYPGVFVILYPHGPRARTKTSSCLDSILFNLYDRAHIMTSSFRVCEAKTSRFNIFLDRGALAVPSRVIMYSTY